jgi:eukaryotic-like serine/threonine-protein kinase
MAKKIGPYVLGEELERRALTVTYRAQHARIGRTVRIKTLKPTVSIGSPYALEIEREAQILSRLSHEGIVVVHDLIRTEDRVWLVLEDPPGSILTEVALRLPPPRRVPSAVALGLAVLIADALAHAHERGVVHRELRPDCIFVASDGRIKITGFSGAHDAYVPSSPIPFEASETFGRPDYLSPEQILGDDATPETDVYALGTLLYGLLSGRLPFIEEDGADLAHRIRSEAPRPLREVVGATVPSALDALVLRALAKRPEDRFAGAGPMASALTRMLPPSRAAASLAARVFDKPGSDGEPADLEPEPGARTRPSAEMGPLWMRLAGVLGGILIGGAVIQWAAGDDAAPAPLGGPEGTGYLRPLARPWAEVFVDGERVDVTPIGTPIPIGVGRHYVTFRHPQAPDEQREIRVERGQTIVVDVIMRVARDAGAPEPTGPDPEGTP